MKKELKILILEEKPADAEMIEQELHRAGMMTASVQVGTEKDYLKALSVFVPDIILSDYTLPAFDGLCALKLARKKYPDLPFIFVSDTIGEEQSVEALKMGATDCVLKTHIYKLGPAVKRAIQEVTERTRCKETEKNLTEERNLLRTLIDNLPDLIYIKDAESRFIAGNRALASYMGADRPEKLIGKTVVSIKERLLCHLARIRVIINGVFNCHKFQARVQKAPSSM